MEQLKKLKEEVEQELKGNILPYWMKFIPDREYGGFHGHVTHFNQPVEKANKGAVLNARILWTFAAAYGMYEDQAYLDTAKRAYDYILNQFVDREHGGVYWELDYLGGVTASRKQIYALAYTIYAMAEYHWATGEEEALSTAITLFQEIETNAFDKERNGYTEAFTRDWNPVEDLRLSKKDDNESKTMNTHLHIMEAYANLYRVWKDPRLKIALENIIMLFLDRFVDPETYHLNLFFDDDWNLKSNLISYGHDIECSWLLHEAAEVLGKQELIEQTGQIAINMARQSFKGLDKDGGLFYEMFPLENRVDSDKHWWPQAETVVGYFNAYQLSGDREFARKTLGSWEFIRDKIVDRQHGEWYWSVNRDGVPQTEKEKAGFWKCPYHNGRACMEMIRRIEKKLIND
ncbi:MAG: AGE family epimerase/isomerase [Bacteroidota bacterium]